MRVLFRCHSARALKQLRRRAVVASVLTTVILFLSDPSACKPLLPTNKRRNTRVLPSAGKMHLSARRSREQDFLHLRCCIATVAVDRTVKPSVADSHAVYTGHRGHAFGPVGGRAPREIS
jgi:hypothetical protein